MKIRILLLGLAMALAVGVQAQKKDITKFMGIPIDGTKTAMIQKLKAKGFTYNAKMDRLEGEFNGWNSYIKVVTNRNKVFRIYVRDANYMSEREIKRRFLKLVKQFMDNGKYEVSPNWTEQYSFIDDNADISAYNIEFLQLGDSVVMSKGIKSIISENYSEEEFNALSDKEKENVLGGARLLWIEDNVQNKSVWFKIHEFNGKYFLGLYYDNKYNEAHGEDL